MIRILCFLILGCAACSKKPTAVFDNKYQAQDFNYNFSNTVQHKLDVHYTGCGGLLLKKNDLIVMTDPFYSNKSIGSIVLKTIFGGYIKPNIDDIDSAISFSNMDMKKVEAVFISHAHYDHLFDVPYLYENKYDKARVEIFGSHTMKYILENYIPGNALTDVEPIMATRHTNGQWITISSDLKVLPIESHHAPHFKTIKLYSGEHRNKFRKKDGYKSKLNDWREGQTLSYLFHFSDGNDHLNLFVQTSSSDKSLGLPPQQILNQYPIDLAILCVASFDYVEDYPHYAISQLNPKAIMFVHWESFFRDYQHKNGPKTVIGTNSKKFKKQIERYYNGDYWFVKPGVTGKFGY